MPIEIEKKYRLTKRQRQSIERRLREIDAASRPLEFEENTLYRGGRLDLGNCILRLRRVKGQRFVLTFKQRLPTMSAIKHQQEEETEVANADAMHAILTELGYRRALVYEKRRARWNVGAAKVVIDELPFGLYAEIEGEENAIREVEEQLGLADAEAESATYPELTSQYGEQRGDMIEARFKKTNDER